MNASLFTFVALILLVLGFVFPMIGTHNYAAPELKQEYPDCLCPGDPPHVVNWSSVFTSYRCCDCKVRWYLWCLV
jgi:hypothetical protein